MIFHPTTIQGSYLVEPEPFRDERGEFFRYFCSREFGSIGEPVTWVQLNHSITRQKGSIRGMHFQFPPFSEVKMVKVVKGKIFDVIVDLRSSSPSFLKWESFELSEDDHKMLYIPEGCAHGFQCLTDNCHIIYHHSMEYKQGFEGGIPYDDPRLDIKWPLAVTSISARDKSHPYLSENFKGL